ncbi:hypothetical protein MKW92_015416, partial [Papaver armeniacum]
MQEISLLRDFSRLSIHYRYKGPGLFSATPKKQLTPISLWLSNKQQFLPVSTPLSRKQLSVSCCVKKTGEDKVYIKEEDVEVLPKTTAEKISTDKDNVVDNFGALLKAIQKAIVTNSAVYDYISKTFGPVVAWVLPFIPAVLSNIPKNISFKRSEIASKLFATGDLITFPYQGVQVFGVVKE